MGARRRRGIFDRSGDRSKLIRVHITRNRVKSMLAQTCRLACNRYTSENTLLNHVSG